MARHCGETCGPYIVWVNNGYDGWAPYSFETLDEAVAWDRHGTSEFVITKPVSYKVVEADDGA